jgi:Carotenoid biosynthesis protein
MANALLWLVIALYAAFAAAKPLLAGTSLFILVPLVAILAPVLFVLLHAPRQIGWKNLAVFFLLAFVISWSYESLSIATGFPFGNYHYTDGLGWKLGTVPLLIMPAYFGVCYISWLIARTLTQSVAPAQSHGWPVVLVAAFVMVMWDLSMDPSRATVNLTWIWHDGGAYPSSTLPAGSSAWPPSLRPSLSGFGSPLPAASPRLTGRRRPRHLAFTPVSLPSSFPSRSSGRNPEPSPTPPGKSGTCATSTNRLALSRSSRWASSLCWASWPFAERAKARRTPAGPG